MRSLIGSPWSAHISLRHSTVPPLWSTVKQSSIADIARKAMSRVGLGKGFLLNQ